MRSFVIDASVAAKWFFEEEHFEVARRLGSPQRQFCAPDFIWIEMASILWKRARRHELTLQQSQEILADFMEFPLTIVPSTSLLPLAFDLAMTYDRTVYDCLYLALAVTVGRPLITSDRRLANSLTSTPMAKYVRILGRTD